MKAEHLVRHQHERLGEIVTGASGRERIIAGYLQEAVAWCLGLAARPPAIIADQILNPPRERDKDLPTGGQPATPERRKVGEDAFQEALDGLQAAFERRFDDLAERVRRLEGPQQPLVRAETIKVKPGPNGEGAELRRIREAAGLSQRALGELLKRSQVAISIFERGACAMPDGLLDQARAMARKHGRPPP